MTSSDSATPEDLSTGTANDIIVITRRTGWLKRRWLHFLGFDDPEVSDRRVAAMAGVPTPDQVRYAEMIAKQIEVEQSLSNTRMMWNLTFQGFTIAGYALVASSSGATPAKYVLETAIALSSILIAYMTLRGVVASQVQRQYLKDCWAANDLSRFFPEPSSISKTSARRRLPVYSICLILIGMWSALIAAQVALIGDDEPLRVKIE